MSGEGGVVWLDEELLPAKEARISALDRGLLYGDGLFETMRVYHGRPFRAEAHLERLYAGARELHIPLPASPGDLLAAVMDTVGACGESSAYARLTVTRGAGGLPSELSKCPKPTVMIQVRPFGGYRADAYERGYRACTSPVRRNETSPLSRIKSLNYMDSLLARAKATESGYDEALMLNTRGSLAEGSASNLFVVDESRIVTPRAADGCLPGITRDVIMQIGDVAEEEVSPEALLDAQEAFLTNSLMEVMALVALDGKPIGTGKPGPVTQWIHRAYVERVAEECGAP